MHGGMRQHQDLGRVDLRRRRRWWWIKEKVKDEVIAQSRDEFEDGDRFVVGVGTFSRFCDRLFGDLADIRAVHPTSYKLRRPLSIHKARDSRPAAAAHFRGSGRSLDEFLEGGSGRDDRFGPRDVRQETRIQGRQLGVGQLSRVEIGDKARQGEVDLARLSSRRHGGRERRNEVRDRRGQGGHVRHPM